MIKYNMVNYPSQYLMGFSGTYSAIISNKPHMLDTLC